jgi:hypothetical protein
LFILRKKFLFTFVDLITIMYTLTLALLSITASFFLSVTLALPQATCFAGVCYPYVRFGHPNYDEWAQREAVKWEEAERNMNNRDKNKEKHLHDRAESAPAVDISSVSTTVDVSGELAGVRISYSSAFHSLSRPPEMISGASLTSEPGLHLRRLCMGRSLHARVFKARQRPA